MSRQIELNIGKDLQFIRVNGNAGGRDDRAGLIPVIATSSLLPALSTFKGKNG